MRHSRVVLSIELLTFVLVVGCGGDSGSDKCEGLNLCTVAGNSCDSDVVVSCTKNADGCLVETRNDCTLSGQACDPAEPAVCVDPVCTQTFLNGSFDVGSPSIEWTMGSTNFGSPICTIKSDETDAHVFTCSNGGGTGPRSGDRWAWFGGQKTGIETASVAQDITLPASDTATLLFFLEIPASTGEVSDTLVVSIDGMAVFTVTGAHAASYPVYQLVSVDLSPWADGGVHTLLFTGTILGITGTTNFFVDDVSVTPGAICCVDECALVGETKCNGTVIQTCTVGADNCLDWVESTDCKATTRVCDPTGESAVCVSPTLLTVDGGWLASEIPTGGTSKWFYFTGFAGTTYYVWWDDSFEGSGTYTLDILVSGYREDETTEYFPFVDNGYTSSTPVTVVAGETTVYAVAMPYPEKSIGTFAVAVSSTDVHP